MPVQTFPVAVQESWTCPAAVQESKKKSSKFQKLIVNKHFANIFIKNELGPCSLHCVVYNYSRKFDKPKGDDDFHSQGGSDIDPEDLAVMSDMLSGG